MPNVLAHLPLSITYCGCELGEKRILLTGRNFIKVFSLETYQELEDISSEGVNYDSFVTPDEKNIFVMACEGVYHFSLPDFALMKVHRHPLNGLCLGYLKSQKRILFRGDSDLLALDLEASTVTKVKDFHEGNISSIASTSDEEFVFSTGLDKTLKQLSTGTWSELKSVGIESYGRSILLNEETGTILVGMYNGSLAEYSLNGLSLIRTVKAHKSIITRIFQLSSGDVLTCSKDGSVCQPFRDNVSIKVSDSYIFSITELSDKTVAFCCEDGVTIIPPLLLQDPSLLSRIDSISSSLDSIRKSSSDQKNQLVSLLQHHLSQLLIPAKHQPEKFTGLTLSLLPDLKSIQRSYCYEGLPEGRKKILSQNYTLEVISLKSIIPESEAIVTFFDRKLRLLGKISDPKNPLDSFKIKQMRRGKWVFIMNDQTDISGPARVNFTNGYLDCFTFDGCLTDRSGFQATLAVDGVIKEVVSIGNDGMVVTSDRRGYFLNLERNTIEDL